MIGIYDGSLSSLGIPNVEAMKIAEYYRVEKKQFSRLILPSEGEDLSAYDKVYFCSDFECEVPPVFRRAKNVEYVGYAFSEEKYIALENELMDFTLPRATLYKAYLREKFQNGEKAKSINSFLDNIYYRAYNGKEVMPIPAGLSRKKIYVSDKDFFYPGWRENLTKLEARHPSGIYFLHPIVCKTMEQFLELRSFTSVSRANDVILDFDFSFSSLDGFLKDNERKFLAEITKTSNVFIPFGARENVKYTIFSFSRELIDRLNILYGFWAHSIPIKLYYIKPKLGEVNRLEGLFEKAKTFSIRFDKDLESRMKGKVKEEYQEFIKLFPKKHNLFIQTYENISRRGMWRYDR